MKYDMKKLSDFADIIVGYAFKSEAFNIDGKGVRLVRGKNITHFALRWGDDTRWWNDFSIDLNRYYLKKGDILIGMDGSLVGKNYARVHSEDLPLLLVQRVACIRAKDMADQDFIWACISNVDFELYIESIKTGTSIPHISAKQISEYLIPDFTNIDREKIGMCIRLLDDKIECNNQINKNLEEQAKGIYRKMFIENPSAEWKKGTLSDIAAITMGQSPNGSSYNEEKLGTVFFQGRAEFGERFPTIRLYTTEPKRMACTNDILMSVRAPVGDLNVAHEDCCIGRGLAAIHSKSKHQSFLLYTMFSLKKQIDVFNGEGTVFGSINRDSLNNISILIPSKEQIDEFESIVAPMDSLIRNNYNESCRLQQIRDTLLPKLMSGELDVSDVDI